MDEMIYNLLLRSRSGLTLFGVLRYQLTGFETDSAPGLDAATPPWQQLARQQQLPTVEVTAYRIRGAVRIPLLTGWQAVPIEGIAYLLPCAQPLVTFGYGSVAPIGFSFNAANRQQIGGGLTWSPTGTAFTLLGRSVR
jgi:hypothetical protein